MMRMAPAQFNGSRSLMRCANRCFAMIAASTLTSAVCAQNLPEPPSASTVKQALVREEPADKPLRIVLLADKKDHGPAGNGKHDYPLWQERWALLLGGRAASDAQQVNLHGAAIGGDENFAGSPGVSVDKAWEWPTEQQFAQSDVIVAFCYINWSAERKRRVREYLAGGGGLVLIHSATWVKPKADRDVAEIVGIGGFSKYRHGLLPINIDGSAHPICRNLPPKIVLYDEPYWPPLMTAQAGKVVSLGTSLESSGEFGIHENQPQFWSSTLAKGRVFGCVPGHFSWSFDDPWFRLLLLRGIAWCGGGSPYRLDDLTLRGARVQ